MDCNSYSYAPSMLDGGSKMIERYENDDMQAELEYCNGVFCVSAFSYDGDLDCYEEYPEITPAVKLYNFIFEHYTSTPPGDELAKFIHYLKMDMLKYPTKAELYHNGIDYACVDGLLLLIGSSVCKGERESKVYSSRASLDCFLRKNGYKRVFA